ncbi:PKD domain-containing protein [Candidatus Acetothermia bacterium]|nr:PKD domain-containing protein [Candidatus Acetothermia bacterium]MBI3643121.1 PKD domain-containing protein [Candidatus Acetothermia bacterium]
MKKQGMVWLLCLTTLGLLAGCSSGQPQKQSQAPNQNQNQNQSTQNQAQTPQNQSPVALFEYAPAVLNTLANITLDASKSSDPDGKIAKYSWDFSDGTKAEGATITHTFAKAGSYSVKLTVTDDKSLTSSLSKTLSITDSTAANRDEHLRLSKGTELRIPISEEPKELLPEATEGTWESDISGLIFDTMVQSDQSFAIIPGFATWEWNPDTKTYIFHIRPGVKFSDGVELTCDDLMFSFKAWTHPDYPGVRFDDFSPIVGAVEYRNRTFGTLSLTPDLVTALDSGALPPSALDAFTKYGITLSGNVAVKIDGTEDAASGGKETSAWSITDSKSQKSYSATRDGDQLTLHLPKGETLPWPISGLKCVDPYTFSVQLNKTQRTFLNYVGASAGIMPKHIYEQYLEANGYDKLKGKDLEIGKIIGAGPYKLAKWEPGQYLELDRNDNYWQSREISVDGQTPLGGVEKLFFIVTPDPQAQLAKLLANEVDVLDTRADVNQYLQLKENAAFDTYKYPQLVYDYWHWNLRNPLFQDISVRKAMCYALDRQTMLNQVLKGLGEVANGPTSPLRWDWDPTIAEVHPQYSVQKTIELMEKAGWTIDKNADGTIKKGAVWTKTSADGQTLKMEFEIATNSSSTRRQDYMILMQEELAAAGFQATTRVLDTNAFYNNYLEGSHNFQTAIAGWKMGTDPDGTSIWASNEIDPVGFNWMAYSNPKVDSLLKEGIVLADIDKAKPIYQEINKILVDTMGYCWLSFQDGTFASKKGLLQIEPVNPNTPYAYLPRWSWDGKGLPVTIKKSNTSNSN